jgi:hypothetical protein
MCSLDNVASARRQNVCWVFEPKTVAEFALTVIPANHKYQSPISDNDTDTYSKRWRSGWRSDSTASNPVIPLPDFELSPSTAIPTSSLSKENYNFMAVKFKETSNYSWRRKSLPVQWRFLNACQKKVFELECWIFVPCIQDDPSFKCNPAPGA